MDSQGFSDLPEALRRLPEEWTAVNRQALETLMPSVYEELRRLAHRQLRQERPGHTLQTTALVHEVYLRLLEQRNLNTDDRAHLLAVAARLMRFILVDYARRRRAIKHGGVAPHVPIDEALVVSPERADRFLELDAALDRLSALDHRKLQVAELRLFGGLSTDEIAGTIGVSAITVKRDWQFARAWLERELTGSA